MSKEELVFIDNEIAPTKAREIELAFTPMVEAMEALAPQMHAIRKIKPGDITEQTCEEAKILRLKYGKVRTATAGAHKEQKAPFLKAGKFIDGLKNAQDKASKEIENELRNIENYFIDQEKDRILKLHTDRLEQVKGYLGADEIPDFGSMPDNIWEMYLQGAKANALTKAVKASSLESLSVEKHDYELLIEFKRFVSDDDTFMEHITIDEGYIHNFLNSIPYRVFLGQIKEEGDQK